MPGGGHGEPVQGNVTYVCDVTCFDDPKDTDHCPDDGADCCEQSVNGTVREDPGGIDWWPETWAITKFFKDQVEGLDSIDSDTIDAKDNPNIGPLYRDGDLDIQSTEKNARITLNGTLYVTGSLILGGSKDFVLDLNEQIIFVECADESPHEAIIIDRQCIIEGTGAIMAVGSINAMPSTQTSKNDFVFLMSIEGGINIQPLGDWYGSIAGHDYVDIKPNNGITYTSGEDFWNTFPDTDKDIIKIATYDIVGY
jgi:hypothetical protein